jgi:hypothetical protein
LFPDRDGSLTLQHEVARLLRARLTPDDLSDLGVTTLVQTADEAKTDRPIWPPAK